MGRCLTVKFLSKMMILAGVTRPPFLILALICVGLGIASAHVEQGFIDPTLCILALLGGISAHISVNTLNEYFDFKSGLDFKTNRTPFSGGSGVLPKHPFLAPKALLTGLLFLGITALIGCYFLWLRGWFLLAFGLPGLALVAFYTPFIVRRPFLCLIAPGIAFGPIMVAGTAFVLTGEVSGIALAASLPVFFLVNNLLLLNQFPDIDADQAVGRKNVTIQYGHKKSAYLLGLSYFLGFGSIVAGIILGFFPTASLFAFLPAILSITAFYGAQKHADEPQKLTPYMARTLSSPSPCRRY